MKVIINYKRPFHSLFSPFSLPFQTLIYPYFCIYHGLICTL